MNGSGARDRVAVPQPERYVEPRAKRGADWLLELALNGLGGIAPGVMLAVIPWTFAGAARIVAAAALAAFGAWLFLRLARSGRAVAMLTFAGMFGAVLVLNLGAILIAGSR
jgi:hypothetical protein